LSDWYENLSKCSTYPSRPDLWWRVNNPPRFGDKRIRLVALEKPIFGHMAWPIERGIDFSFNELQNSPISLGIPLSHSWWSDAKHYWCVPDSTSSCLGNFRLCSPFLGSAFPPEYKASRKALDNDFKLRLKSSSYKQSSLLSGF